MYSLIFTSFVLWLMCFGIDNGTNILFINRGGGGGVTPPPTPAAPPAPPSPGETSREAIDAQIEAVPRILETQREFGPQFSQLELEQLQQFGPEFAQVALDLSKEFGPQLAEATRDEQRILAPERVAGSEALASFLEEGPDQLTDQEESQFKGDIRSAQSTRGLAESGFGAREEFEKLTGLRQQLKSRFLNVALASSGRLPGAGSASVTPTGSAGQLIQNVDPGQIFGAQAANQQTQASIFNTQAGFASSIFGTAANQASARRGQNFGLIGQGIGAGSDIGSAFIMA